MSEDPLPEDPQTEPAADEPADTRLDDEMTPEQLAEAKEYGRHGLFCDLAGRAVDLAFLCLMAFALGRPDGWLMSVIPGEGYPETVRLVALLLILTVLNMLVGFPVSFYGGHVLEHRYGLSRMSLRRWLWRYFKGQSLELVFGVIMLSALYWLIWLTGPWWWLAAAVAFFLVSVVLGQLAPVLILPLFYKTEPLEGDEHSDELRARMDRLAEGTGLSIQGVYRLMLSAETVKANAALAGLGGTRRVLMGDTLLKNFSADEIEVVFAHEVGHHVFRHIRKMMITGGLASVAAFWVSDWVLGAWIRFNGQTVDYANFPIYTLPMFALIMFVLGNLAEPLANIVSRHYERQCDRYALERTGLRDAYRSAFRKLAKLNKDDPDPHPVEVFLFHNHPPIAERLAMADQ